MMEVSVSQSSPAQFPNHENSDERNADWGSLCPPRPDPTRVCVPARCLWLFLDKFEMEVFVVSPNLLSIYYTKS